VGVWFIFEATGCGRRGRRSVFRAARKLIGSPGMVIDISPESESTSGRNGDRFRPESATSTSGTCTRGVYEGLWPAEWNGPMSAAHGTAPAGLRGSGSTSGLAVILPGQFPLKKDSHKPTCRNRSLAHPMWLI
jgi:hypothetical protein